MANRAHLVNPAAVAVRLTPTTLIQVVAAETQTLERPRVVLTQAEVEVRAISSPTSVQDDPQPAVTVSTPQVPPMT